IILFLADAIAQHASIAQRQREAAAKARVARRREIPDQHDAIAIGVIGPGIRRVERGKGSDRVAISKPIGRRTRRDLFVDKSLLVLPTARGGSGSVAENQIGAVTVSAYREDDREPLHLGAQNELNCTLRQSEVPVEGAHRRETVRVPLDLEA